MEKISLCMIVKNEEKYIAACLKSAALLVDEIILVDTGSTDSTLEIAEGFQARIFHYPWKENFAHARNYSLAQATGEWILVLDADEALYHEDIEKLKHIVRTTTANAISLKFHNFILEDSEEEYNTHVGIRLFRNHIFQYEGAIHEQLVAICEETPLRLKATDVRVGHYGYLKSNAGKRKRERNIPLIQKLLEENPEDAFQLFNMGNEFMSDGAYENALLYFEKAYVLKDTTLAYCPHLIFRRAICLYYLKRFRESLNILEEGTMIYPQCTTYQFFKGRIYKGQKKYSLAIECFEDCIAKGSAPLSLTFINDLEDFRSFVELAQIYFLQDDYGKALAYYLKAIDLKNHRYDLLYKIGETLNKMHSEKKKVGKGLEKLFADGYYLNNVIVIVDILLNEGLYEEAREYFQRIEEKQERTEEIQYLNGRILFYEKEYALALEKFTMVLESASKEFLLPEVEMKALEYAVVCIMVLEHKAWEAKEIILNIAKNKEENGAKKVVQYFLAEIEVPLKGEEEKMALHVLSKLLRNKEFDVFEASLKILNMIDSNEVLLDLAEIYYENGFKELAVKTILRSMKELGVINAQAVQLLNKEFLLVE